jgi:hypothetical protein
MNLLTVFIFVLIIVLIYAVYKLLTKTTTTVSGFSDASKQLVVPSQKLKANYSVWIYVDAWRNTATAATQYKKNILTRLGTVYTNSGGATNNAAPIYLLHLDNATNDLHLRIALTGGSASAITPYQTCTIKNIKLQKWVNITMSIYGNTVDLYLDGKLVKTCVLTAMPIALTDTDTNLYVGGSMTTTGVPSSTDGDLVGYISNVLYKDDYFTPEDAWDIYSAGYGGAGMFDFANQYKLNFSITKDNQTMVQLST